MSEPLFTWGELYLIGMGVLFVLAIIEEIGQARKR
jgi:hypothetical protein